ncbi:MAG: 4Fe-4S binding protein [Thermodesulfobacteriota bacterium]
MPQKTKTPPAAKKAAPSAAAEGKGKKKLYNVIFFHDWCKACGLCTALCAKKIILTDETGQPYIDEMDSCVGCRFCEIHCPDFAITIKNRHPERRKTDGRK